MRAEILAVALHDLTRHGARDAGVGEVVDEDVERLVDPHLEGVAVDDLESLDRRVVVEAVLLARLLRGFLGADHVGLDLGDLRGAHLWIEDALE